MQWSDDAKAWFLTGQSIDLLTRYLGARRGRHRGGSVPGGRSGAPDPAPVHEPGDEVVGTVCRVRGPGSSTRRRRTPLLPLLVGADARDAVRTCLGTDREPPDRLSRAAHSAHPLARTAWATVLGRPSGPMSLPPRTASVDRPHGYAGAARTTTLSAYCLRTVSNGPPQVMRANCGGPSRRNSSAGSADLR